MKIFPVVLVLALSACSGQTEDNIAVGTLERDRAELRAPASEPVVARFADDGLQVAEGDILLQLDDTIATARLAQLRAMEQKAAARLAEIRRGARAEQLDQARARLASASSQAELATIEFERQQQLFDRKLASQEQRDAAKSAAAVARANRDNAHAALSELLHGATPEQLDQAVADHAASLAAVAEQQARIAELAIRAPYDGVVERMLVETGDRPATGALLATVYRADAPYARVFMPADAKQQYRSGDMFAVFVDGHGCYPASLRYIATVAAFTPYYSLRESDRGRLVYPAELQLGASARNLPIGIPVEVHANTCP